MGLPGRYDFYASWVANVAQDEVQQPNKTLDRQVNSPGLDDILLRFPIVRNTSRAWGQGCQPLGVCNPKAAGSRIGSFLASRAHLISTLS